MALQRRDRMVELRRAEMHDGDDGGDGAARDDGVARFDCTCHSVAFGMCSARIDSQELMVCFVRSHW